MGIRIDGATGENVTSCTSCGEVIYPDVRALVNHHIENLPDGRMCLYSRDFERVVHLCSLDAIAAQAESVVVEATSLLV